MTPSIKDTRKQIRKEEVYEDYKAPPLKSVFTEMQDEMSELDTDRNLVADHPFSENITRAVPYVNKLKEEISYLSHANHSVYNRFEQIIK